MSEFSKADSSVYATFLEMIEKVFPELSNFSFGLLFRSSVKKSHGRVILASICLPTKLLSYYAKNDDGNPFDFLLLVDEMVWACASDDDRIRIMRHELRHVFISEKGAPKLVDHDFQDFHVEVELNADNPNWENKLCEVALAGYKQVKEGQKDPRVNRRDADDLAPVTKSPQRQTQLEAFTEKTSKDASNKIIERIAKDGGRFDGKSKPELDQGFESFVGDTSKGASEKLDDMARKRGLLPDEATMINKGIATRLR